MRRIFLFLALFTLTASFALAQRLPALALPESYKLTFAPDFEADTFAGEEAIHIRILQTTSQIVLNAAELQFDGASISSGGQTQPIRVTLDKEKEMATLAFDRAIEPGPADVHLRYTGILNDALRGFYLGRDKKGHKYAVTQFEPTDARRAFPSFDEPAYKAIYEITVITDAGLTVLSNAQVSSDTAGPGKGKHTVKFAPTAKMSSYLVAMAVGQFEYVQGEADGIPIRVYGTPGTTPYDGYALEVAEQCMRYYNRYFGIKYPFEKLDLIGLPDFAAGAMENTGLITFREVILQLDDKQASVELQKEVALVVAHEMAHMWFGDLVTMQWWDDIWLNEGFASWMERKAVGVWKPEWHMEEDAVRDTADTFNLDSLKNTRPIHQPAETPAQIEELFDGIAYGKAASVLRMLEAYLGPETFRTGVDEYLKQHSYGNATADDFWKILTALSKKPVDQIMPTWINQAGVPMVSVRTQCTGRSTAVTLSQRRYFDDRALFDAGSPELWEVPVCMREGGGKGADRCVLLTRAQESFDLPGCSSWVMVNAGAKGYYRSGYSRDMQRAMSLDLETQLTPAERIVLLSDSWAAVRVGRQQIGDYLSLAEGLAADRDRAVLNNVASQLDYISDKLVTDADRSQYQLWVRQLLRPAARELGWQPKPGESDETRSLRTRVMYTLGYAGRDPQVLDEARRLAEQVLENPASVERTIAFTAFKLSALTGDAALYDEIYSRLESGDATPEEYYLYFSTLSQFSDPKLLERTLQFAVSSQVRTQDTLGLIADVMRNPAGTSLAWDFARSHWAHIEKIGGGFTSGEVVAATGSFCDPQLRDQATDFFSTHQVPTAERTLKQAIERMNYCVDLKSQQTPQLSAWLDQHGAASGR